MPSSQLFRVLDAATSFAVDVGRLIETAKPRLIDAAQLRSAANSIGANIAEGYGRNSGPDRVHFFRIARGSTEEAIQHLRLNFRSGKIPVTQFYALSNKARTIVKMLESLIAKEVERTKRLEARA
jgi:four helix bundle protein